MWCSRRSPDFRAWAGASRFTAKSPRRPARYCWWTTTATIRANSRSRFRRHAKAGRDAGWWWLSSRTRDLFEDFAEVLSQVDALVLLEVYAAGETPIAGADARALARSIRNRGRVDPVYVLHTQDLPQALAGVLHDGDLLLTLGAGDIGAMAAELPQHLAAAHTPAVPGKEAHS